MADLLDRVLGNLTPEESHLSLLYPSLIAALRERQRGELTRNQIKAALGLTDAEDTALNTVYQTCINPQGSYNFDELADLLVLGSTRNRADAGGAPYYTKAAIKTRLGI